MPLTLQQYKAQGRSGTCRNDLRNPTLPDDAQAIYYLDEEVQPPYQSQPVMAIAPPIETVGMSPVVIAEPVVSDTATTEIVTNKRGRNHG